MPVLRVIGPAKMSQVTVLRGNDGNKIFLERILEADLVIIQRDFPHLDGYNQVISQAKTAQKPVVYEIDDLLFELPESHISFYNYSNSLLAMIQAAVEADAVVTSCAPLQKYFLNFNPHTWLIPNFLDDTLWPLKSMLPSAGQIDPVIIGYMGGQTHQPDIQMLVPVLANLLDKYGERIRIHFWGGQPPAELKNSAQVEWTSLDILEYPKFVDYFSKQVSDIFIAPLRDTYFNQHKSAIKYLEYSSMGIPAVCSRINPYQDLIQSGENGFLAGQTGEWQTALEKLIDNPDLRQRIGEQALKTTRQNWLLSNRAPEWLNVYNQILNQYQSSKEQSPLIHSITLANQQHRQIEHQLAHLSLKNNELESQQQALAVENARLNNHLQSILNSHSWRMLTQLQKIRERMLPPGGRMESISRKVFHLVRARGINDNQNDPKLQKSPDYATWITENEPDSAELISQNNLNLDLQSCPRFSVIMPIDQFDIASCEPALNSLAKQTYKEWELSIICYENQAGEITTLKDKIFSSQQTVNILPIKDADNKVKFVNKIIIEKQNDWIVLCDQNNLLAQFALFELFQAVNHNPNIDIIYADSDSLDLQGVRQNPFFKPDWSPELLLSLNYMGNLIGVRSSSFKKFGEFDADMEGDWIWDWLIRLSETRPGVAHVRKILFHEQHIIEPDNQIRDSIKNHLAEMARDNPWVTSETGNVIHVGWSLPKSKRVSILIPSRGLNAMLEKCISSIISKTDYLDYEIIVINNGINRPEFYPYYEAIKNDPRIRIEHYEGDFNYSRVNNFAARLATGDFLLFLNNDTEIIQPDWLMELVMWADRPEVGAVGAKLLMMDKTIQHAGIVLGLSGFAGHIFSGAASNQKTIFGSTDWYRDYLAITAACMMVRKKLFLELGCFNEDFLLCGNDVEFCLRLNQGGYRVVYNPFCTILHLESATHKGSIPAKDFITSYRYYATYLKQGDPYFNPNLSYWNSIPSLRQKNELPPHDFVIEYINKSSR